MANEPQTLESREQEWLAEWERGGEHISSDRQLKYWIGCDVDDFPSQDFAATLVWNVLRLTWRVGGPAGRRLKGLDEFESQFLLNKQRPYLWELPFDDNPTPDNGFLVRKNSQAWHLATAHFAVACAVEALTGEAAGERFVAQFMRAAQHFVWSRLAVDRQPCEPLPLESIKVSRANLPGQVHAIGTDDWLGWVKSLIAETAREVSEQQRTWRKELRAIAPAAIAETLRGLYWILEINHHPDATAASRQLIIPLAFDDNQNRGGCLADLEIDRFDLAPGEEQAEVFFPDPVTMGLTTFDPSWRQSFARALSDATSRAASRPRGASAYAWTVRFRYGQPGFYESKLAAAQNVLHSSDCWRRAPALTGPSASIAAALLLRAWMENKYIEPTNCVTGAVGEPIGNLIFKAEALQQLLQLFSDSRFHYHENCSLSEIESLRTITKIDHAPLKDFTNHDQLYQQLVETERITAVREYLQNIIGTHSNTHLLDRQLPEVRVRVALETEPRRERSSNESPRQLPLPHLAHEETTKTEPGRQVCTIDWDSQLSSQVRQALILADPGYGKTWLLKHQAIRVAESSLSELRQRSIIDEIVLPVFLRFDDLAKEIIETEGAVGASDFTAAIGRLLRRKYKRSPVVAQILRNIKLGRNCCVLLDAWDEVPPKQQRGLWTALKAWLAEWNVALAQGHRHANQQVLMTSRLIGRPDSLWLDSGERQRCELKLVGFDFQQVTQFVRSFFRRQKREWTAALLAELADAKNVESFTQIPILLTLLCEYVEGQAAAGQELASLEKLNPAHLYDHRLCTLLAATWREEQAPPADVAELRGLLAAVAFELLKQGRRQFTLHEFKQMFLEQAKATSLWKKPARLFAQVKASGLLTANYGGKDAPHRFLHLTIQEHLAAVHLHVRREFCYQTLAKHWDHPHLRNTWKMVVQMGNEDDKHVNRLLSIVLDEQNHHPDDGFLLRHYDVALSLLAAANWHVPYGSSPRQQLAKWIVPTQVGRYQFPHTRIADEYYEPWREHLRRNPTSLPWLEELFGLDDEADCLQLAERIRREIAAGVLVYEGPLNKNDNPFAYPKKFDPTSVTYHPNSTLAVKGVLLQLLRDPLIQVRRMAVAGLGQLIWDSEVCDVLAKVVLDRQEDGSVRAEVEYAFQESDRLFSVQRRVIKTFIQEGVVLPGLHFESILSRFADDPLVVERCLRISEEYLALLHDAEFDSSEPDEFVVVAEFTSIDPEPNSVAFHPRSLDRFALSNGWSWNFTRWFAQAITETLVPYCANPTLPKLLLALVKHPACDAQIRVAAADALTALIASREVREELLRLLHIPEGRLPPAEKPRGYQFSLSARIYTQVRPFAIDQILSAVVAGLVSEISRVEVRRAICELIHDVNRPLEARVAALHAWIASQDLDQVAQDICTVLRSDPAGLGKHWLLDVALALKNRQLVAEKAGFEHDDNEVQLFSYLPTCARIRELWNRQRWLETLRLPLVRETLWDQFENTEEPSWALMGAVLFACTHAEQVVTIQARISTLLGDEDQRDGFAAGIHALFEAVDTNQATANIHSAAQQWDTWLRTALGNMQTSDAIRCRIIDIYQAAQRLNEVCGVLEQIISQGEEYKPEDDYEDVFEKAAVALVTSFDSASLARQRAAKGMLTWTFSGKGSALIKLAESTRLESCRPELMEIVGSDEQPWYRVLAVRSLLRCSQRPELVNLFLQQVLDDPVDPECFFEQVLGLNGNDFETIDRLRKEFAPWMNEPAIRDQVLNNLRGALTVPWNRMAGGRYIAAFSSVLADRAFDSEIRGELMEFCRQMALHQRAGYRGGTQNSSLARDSAVVGGVYQHLIEAVRRTRHPLGK